MRDTAQTSSQTSLAERDTAQTSTAGFEYVVASSTQESETAYIISAITEYVSPMMTATATEQVCNEVDVDYSVPAIFADNEIAETSICYETSVTIEVYTAIDSFIVLTCPALDLVSYAYIKI